MAEASGIVLTVEAQLPDISLRCGDILYLPAVAVAAIDTGQEKAMARVSWG